MSNREKTLAPTGDKMTMADLERRLGVLIEWRDRRPVEFPSSQDSDLIWQVDGHREVLPRGSLFAIERRIPESGELAAYAINDVPVLIGRFIFQKKHRRALLVQKRRKRAIPLDRNCRLLGTVVPLDEFRFDARRQGPN